MKKTIKAWAIVRGGKFYVCADGFLPIFKRKKSAEKWNIFVDEKIVPIEIKILK